MLLSSDPPAWLRAYFVQLQTHPAFRTFAPAHQFAQLVQVLEREHPAKAAEMRQWSTAAQHALLLHLASTAAQKATAAPFELWKVRKGERGLRCIAVYLPTGIDVRLMEDGDFRRTKLCKDAPEVHELSDQWRAALVGVGWTLL